MTKRDAVLFLLFLILLAAAIWRACSNDPAQDMCAYAFPSYNPDHPPPAGTPPDQVFELSQNYPATAPAETGAWTAIDYETDPQGYGAAVLAYCLEGNVAVDFRVQQNAVRGWYHAPWLHWGENGREWRHGMTRERGSRPGELHPNQTSNAFSWAVGFYNAKGGATLRKVWPDCGKTLPRPSMADFPEGTVAFKLLFTSASTAQVPYLQNSFTWTVNTGPPNGPRTDGAMRLLQVDIAVKDARAPIGWVFGTFVYDGLAAGATPWERLQLVGLSWGNDPTVTSHMTEGGAFLNSDLAQSWINASLIPGAGAPVAAARVYHLGLGGRLNGPVDNPISSCTSCHGKAAILKDGAPDPIENLGRMPRVVPRSTPMPADYNALKFGDFFGVNVTSGSGDIDYNCFVSDIPAGCNDPNLMTTFVKTDYSLQVAVGIENYYSSIQDRADAFLEEFEASRR